MKLPIGYKELEYVETTGKQVLDTGVRINQDTRFRLDLDILTSNNTRALHLFSANDTSPAAYYAHRLTDDCSDFAVRYGKEALRKCGISNPYGRRTFERNKNIMTFSTGESIESPYVVFSPSKTFVIGGLNQQNGGYQSFSKVRIHHSEIWPDGEHLERDLIPCETPEKKIGVYDLVSKQVIIPSPALIAGPEIIYTPGQVTDLQAAIDSQSVLLSWSGGENAEGYKVYRDSDFLEEVPVSQTQYLDSDVPYGTHTYEISTVNRYGESQKVSISVTLAEEKSVAKPEKTTIVYLLDKNYDAYDAIDKFKSMLWTVRFAKAGEFELYVPADLEIVKRFHEGDYAWIEDSDRLMIVEDINLQTDAEDGDYLIISGRSLESILERRIIWGMTVITGNFQNGIKTLLERNVISPAIESRKIPNFTFKESTDPRITELTVEAQYFGENLYEEIEKLCEEKKVGFRVLPKGAGGFEFSLYAGEDRSYNQIKNPWVVFAPNYENLQSSNYLYSKKNFKNATLVGGQGENWSRDTVEVVSDLSSGLDRRETFTDASGVTNDTSGIENDETLTEEEKQAAITALTEEYNEQLRQKGQEELSKTSITETFDGEIDASIQYVYREDFDLGDIVQIVNAYGMEASTRVSEIVISHDATGKTVVPTFTVKEDEKGDDN